PEEAAMASDRGTFVLGALGKLREEDRLVIAYRYFMQLSEAEMADALGCARGTVKSRLSRALARLREVAGGEASAGELAAGRRRSPAAPLGYRGPAPVH